jgi:hypothetical protein
MIDTKIVGSPAQIEEVGRALTSSVYPAVERVRGDLNTIRNVSSDVWSGDDAVAASEDADDLRRSGAKFIDTIHDLARALQDFAADLRQIQAMMDEHLYTAQAAGLEVRDRLVYPPPAMMIPTYPEGQIPPSVLADLEARDALVTAYEAVAEDVDRVIGSYSDACRDLAEAVGGITERDWVAEFAIAAVPGSLTYLGKTLIPAYEGRIGTSRHLSRALSGIEGSKLGNLTTQLIGSIDRLDDAQIAGRLATAGGNLADRFLIGFGIVTDLRDGENLEQAAVSQAGAALAGTGSFLFLSGLGSIVGVSTGPAGWIAMGGTVILSTLAGIAADDYLDDWFEDREFEQLIRDGLTDQGAP